jgi:carbamoylphosphate synthase large subunit
MKQRIWFNRWFSTAFHFINLIRNNPDGKQFEIYASHSNPNSVVLQAADKTECEPLLKGDEYIDYCLDFCKRNKIEIFIPGHTNLVTISQNVKEFESQGTKVLMSSDSKMFEIITDKAKTYESFKKHNIMTIPEYYIVNTAEQFKTAYDKLTANGHQVCFKPNIAEGGNGFRIIDENSESLKALMGTAGARITFEYAWKILAEQERFADLMVLEYLNGAEYSTDCLAYNGRLYAAVPRKKGEGRLRYLEENQELIAIAKKVNDIYKLPYVFNVQVRYMDGVPKLLEVNPRMSGGLSASCLSGINFPYLAVKLLLGEAIEVPKPKFDILISHVDRDVIITGQI